MKTLILILFTPLLSLSQVCSIKSTEHLEKTRKQTYKWHINGQEISPSVESQEVKIHYPEVDTIIFFNNHHSQSKVDTLFTRLKTGEHYVFTISCCDDDYKIYNEKTYELMLIKDEAIYSDGISESYQDSIYKAYTNKFGLVRIEVFNLPKTDTLLVIGDFEMYVIAKIFTTDNNSTDARTAIGEFTNRHNDVLFAKYDPTLKWTWLDQNTVEPIGDEFFDKLQRIKEISIRVFENEIAILRMDYKTGRTELYFEKQ